MYCYQVIFYFLSKLTGKSGTSLIKGCKYLFVIVAKPLVRDTADLRERVRFNFILW